MDTVDAALRGLIAALDVVPWIALVVLCWILVVRPLRLWLRHGPPGTPELRLVPVDEARTALLGVIPDRVREIERAGLRFDGALRMVPPWGLESLHLVARGDDEAYDLTCTAWFLGRGAATSIGIDSRADQHRLLTVAGPVPMRPLADCEVAQLPTEVSVAVALDVHEGRIERTPGQWRAPARDLVTGVEREHKRMLAAYRARGHVRHDGRWTLRGAFVEVWSSQWPFGRRRGREARQRGRALLEELAW